MDATSRIKQPEYAARKTGLTVEWLIGIVAAVAVFAGLWMLRRFSDHGAPWWLFFIPTPVAIIGYHYRKSVTPAIHAAIIGVMVGLVVFFAAVVGLFVVNKIDTPQIFDFPVFWTYARVAVQGQNFYVQSNALQVLSAIHFDVSSAIAQFNFWYPPQSMLLFLPFGAISNLQLSLTLWYLVNIIILVADIYLIWSIFMRQDGLEGLLFTSVITLVLYGGIATLEFAQTTWLLLFFLLLYWRDRERPRAGIWLACAIFIKPFIAGLVLYVLLRRHWKVLLSLIGTGIVLTVAAMLVFGTDTFMSYFTKSLSAVPNEMYTQIVNQSLVATVSRLTAFTFDRSPFMQPLFLLPAGILFVVSAWLILRSSKQQDGWSVALALMLGMLLYPHSLNTYTLIMIVPLMLFWTHRRQFPGGSWTAIVLIIGLYALFGYQSGRQFVFVSYLILWCTIVMMHIRENRLPPQVIQTTSLTS